MVSFVDDIAGSFEQLSELEEQKVMEIVAEFHYRTGRRHPDGSLGMIEISPKQFNDCLAYMVKKEDV